MVVRDSQHRDVSECLDRLRNHYGVGLNLSLCDIPEQEEWGTADSLRHIRSKVKVSIPYLSLATGIVDPLPFNGTLYLRFPYTFGLYEVKAEEFFSRKLQNGSHYKAS